MLMKTKATNSGRHLDRRQFLEKSAQGVALLTACAELDAMAQAPGERPSAIRGVEVVNPRLRVPVGLIIDDSTCLVNLNRFAMPQFDQAHEGRNPAYHKPWREWPAEIPDAFVRKFGEWCADHGVKGKYSIVPYPACVGRMDRFLPGWTHRELEQSLEVVRSVMMPHWDIHPEMISHTRVIDLKSGQPYTESSLKFMENWDWTTGRSTDEIASYLAYALSILKNAGLPCEGITTPGGFGNQARPQLSQGTLESVRSVFGAEIPHYFRDLFDEGNESVAPRVEYASGLEGPDPRCVVSILGCTGDWTGGWDCSTPEGPDRFISADLKHGRMVDVIERGEPALMVCHWTGIYWNGQELGFKIFQEVVRRLHARFDHLIWMKLSAVARYWAARQLTRITRTDPEIRFQAPFACPDFTVSVAANGWRGARQRSGQTLTDLKETSNPRELVAGKWCQQGEKLVICVDLPKGPSNLELIGAGKAS
jgi:hypothetical protein